MSPACVSIAILFSSCTPKRELYFGGDAVAQIEEKLDSSRNITRVVSFGDERITLRATLDDQGRAVQAHYSRAGLREVDLTTKNAVLIDLLQHARPTTSLDVNLVDLSSAESIPGRVTTRGAEVVALDSHDGIVARVTSDGTRIGPGVFVEGKTRPAQPAPVVNVRVRAAKGLRLLGVDDVIPAMNLDGPGQRHEANAVLFVPDYAPADAPDATYTLPAPFIESDNPRIIAFARKAGSIVGLVEAIHPLVDARKKNIPPSAINMLTHGGDCDGAAALTVASLRALGLAARPVVGYRHVDGRLVPHAWAEVHTPDGWLLVDASVPRIGNTTAHLSHLKLFHGLGGALTMGRVLGRLQVDPL